MVRIKDGNYIAIFRDRMIEVKADSKRDAYNKAKRYFELVYVIVDIPHIGYNPYSSSTSQKSSCKIQRAAPQTVLLYYFLPAVCISIFIKNCVDCIF